MKKLLISTFLIFFVLNLNADENFKLDLIYLCGPDLSVTDKDNWSFGLDSDEFTQHYSGYDYFYVIIDLDSNERWNKIVLENYRTKEQYPSYFKSFIEHTGVSNGMTNYSEFIVSDIIEITATSVYVEYEQFHHIKNYTFDKNLKIYTVEFSSEYKDGRKIYRYIHRS